MYECMYTHKTKKTKPTGIQWRDKDRHRIPKQMAKLRTLWIKLVRKSWGTTWSDSELGKTKSGRRSGHTLSPTPQCFGELITYRKLGNLVYFPFTQQAIVLTFCIEQPFSMQFVACWLEEPTCHGHSLCLWCSAPHGSVCGLWPPIVKFQLLCRAMRPNPGRNVAGIF